MIMVKMLIAQLIDKISRKISNTSAGIMPFWAKVVYNINETTKCSTVSPYRINPATYLFMRVFVQIMSNITRAISSPTKM